MFSRWFGGGKKRDAELHAAAKAGDLAGVRLALEKGANINALDREYQETVLHVAVDQGNKKLVQFLLSKGAKASTVKLLNAAIEKRYAAPVEKVLPQPEDKPGVSNEGNYGQDVAAIRAMSLIEFGETFYRSVRFRNAITAYAAQKKLPFETIGEYLDAGEIGQRALFKVQNLGVTSINGLNEAIREAMHKPPAPATPPVEPLATKRLDLVEEIESLYPRILAPLLVEYSATPETERIACTRLEAEMQRFLEDKRLAEVAVRRFNGETLAEIGESLGISRERVRQIEAQAKPWLAESVEETEIPSEGTDKLRPDGIREAWYDKYLRLKAYYEREGNAEVPYQWPEDPPLGTWVANQRQKHKKGELLPEQINLLEALGFSWSLRERGTWEDRFNELVEFKQRHGHFDVPTNYPEAPKLKPFISSTRHLFKEGSLESERIELLREIGFSFDTGSRRRGNGSPPIPLNELPAGFTLEGRTIAITGRLERYTRDEATRLARNQGANVLDKFSGKVELLVVGSDAASKLDAALQRGIPVIDEDHFTKMITAEEAERVVPLKRNSVSEAATIGTDTIDSPRGKAGNINRVASPAAQQRDVVLQWLEGMLKIRWLNAPDGRMLYGYNLAAAEFESLESLLVLACQANKFSLLLSHNAAFPALFVLFASEWWRREYEGGAWSWDPMVERLAGADADVSQQTLSECVTVGLHYWGHRPCADGKRFLGAIVAHGGIPMRLLAQGEGKLPVALAQIIKYADRYNWSFVQIQEAVEERLPLLPQSYRRQEIARLLADFASAVVELKQTHQLGNVTDPIAHLDQTEPDWKRRFPISLEHDAAQTLLVGLVRDVATQKSATSQTLFRCERRLIETGEKQFALESVLSSVSRADADSLAGLFGMNGSESLPRYFTVDLGGQSRREFLDGRPINGADPPAVRLLGSRLTQRGVSALAEHALVLRSDSDVGVTATVSGELPLEDPWIFVERDGEVPRYVGAGGVRLPDSEALVVLPTGWEIVSESVVTFLGALANIVPPRTVIRVVNSCTLKSDELTYQLRLKQTSEEPLLFQWSGNRISEAAGKLVFKANDRLRLFKSIDERLVSVPAVDQVWQRPGTGETLTHREARGPVEVRVIEAGETVSRQRIFVLPPDARIAYQTDPDHLGSATIRFENWGLAEFGVEPRPDMTSQTQRTSGGVDIQLDARDEPPGSVRVLVHWPGCPTELALELPYPATGGRFVRGDGEPFASGQRIGIEDLLGARLRVFDTNPARPKSYALQLGLQGGRTEHQVRFPIKLDSTGHAEVRLIDYQRNIVSLMGMTDRLDDAVAIRLLIAEQPAGEIQIARYVASLSRDGQCVSLQTSDLPTFPLEKLRSAEVFARPLVSREADQRKLPPQESEGTPTGYWLATELDGRGNPWLIYPGPESALQFRPMVWIAEEAEATPNFYAAGESSEICQLAQAMLLPEPDTRWNALHDVVKIMGGDAGHRSWPLALAQWSAFKHLPLPALDLWRMVARQPRAVITLLINAGLPERDVPDLARRFRDEVGWWPELTSLNDWHEALKRLWAVWSAQLPSHLAKPIFLDHITRRFGVLRSEFPGLEILLDFVEFELTGSPSDALDAIWSVCDIRSDVLLHALWQGQDSIGNRQLLQVNTDREDSDWCEHKLMEDSAKAFASALDSQRMGKLHPRLKFFFKDDIHPKRLTIANMPMLCALWATLSVSKSFWIDMSHRISLRRVRDFDPIWFEQGYRHAVAAVLTIDGLVEPTRFIDFPD